MNLILVFLCAQILHLHNKNQRTSKGICEGKKGSSETVGMEVIKWDTVKHATGNSSNTYAHI